MHRKPRDTRQGVFGKRTLGISLIQGLAVMTITVGIYAFSRTLGMQVEESRALTYTTLILANLGLILSNRSWSSSIWSTLRGKNVALWWVTLSALVFLGLALYVPVLRDLFSFAVLSSVDILIAVCAAMLSIAWFEIFKQVRGKKSG
jgi:Ca2+-transporting ATPase